jgi:hypothetical protein
MRNSQITRCVARDKVNAQLVEAVRDASEKVLHLERLQKVDRVLKVPLVEVAVLCCIVL